MRRSALSAAANSSVCMWPHGSQCFDEGDRCNWTGPGLNGTWVGTRVGHTGPGYPSTPVLASLVTVPSQWLRHVRGTACHHLSGMHRR